jgi:hypothetical protein
MPSSSVTKGAWHDDAPCARRVPAQLRPSGPLGVDQTLDAQVHMVVLGLTGLSAIVLAGVVGRFTERAPGAPVTVEQAVGETLFAVDAVALVLGVLGVLLVTGEYGSGSIRASLTAVPRRLPVLATKALVLVAVAAPLGRHDLCDVVPGHSCADRSEPGGRAERSQCVTGTVRRGGCHRRVGADRPGHRRVSRRTFWPGSGSPPATPPWRQP